MAKSRPQLVITIDGPAGSGKSTVARRLAERLGAAFLDTGAMYRAITLAALQDGVDLRDEPRLAGVVQKHRFDFEAAPGRMLVSIDGRDVTDALRDSTLTAQVRYAAAAPQVREQLVALQRAFAARQGRIVTEGRDQGTVVFPQADAKFYLTADVGERARRRQADLDAQGEPADLEQIRRAIEARDRSDESRAVGPLKPATDALTIDTTDMTVAEVVEEVHRQVLERTQAEGSRPAAAGRKTGDRGPRTDDRGQTTEGGGRRTEGRERKTQDSGHSTEGGKQKAESRAQKGGCGRQETKDEERVPAPRGEPAAPRPSGPRPPLRPADILPAAQEQGQDALATEEQGQDVLAPTERGRAEAGRVQAGQGEESETPLARDQQPSTPEATDTSSTTAADPRLPPASSLQPPASHVQPAASSPSPSFRDRLKVAWYWLAWTGCQIFCAVFFRVRVSGRESVPRNGACLLAGNHQSYMDPVFCGVGVRRRLTFVARDTLFRYRLFAALIHSLNAIPIERDKPDVSAIKAIIARLRAGEAVCLYPEATRTRDGRIVPFKPGFGLLCRRARAAVVPVLVDGAFECWPRHRRLFAPGHVTIWYGRPLDPDEIRTLTNEQLADRLTATLRQMQHDCRLRRGKQPYDYAAAPSADRQPQ